MADSNIELILDALSSAVAGVTPGVLSTWAFQQHEGSTPLDEADDTQAFRFFEWRDTGEFKVGDPASDSTNGWYTTVLELRVFYPATLLIEGYNVKRGLAGVRLRDRVDLNKRLMYGDPLSALTDDYKLLKLVDARKSDKMLSLFYEVSWSESLA
jgi:hypothetical protein